MSLSKIALIRGSSLGCAQGAQRFLANTSCATGVTKIVDLDVTDFDLVTIVVQMSAAVGTDLAVTVVPIGLGGSAAPCPLPVTAPAVTFGGSSASQCIQVNTTGLSGIEIQVKNNNAGTETINFVDVFAGVTGTDF